MKKLLIIAGCIFAAALIWFICSLALPTLVLGDRENELIHEYLEQNIRRPGFGGQYYSSFRVLKIDKDTIYLYVRLQEYYNGRMGSGSSGPIALKVKVVNDELEILTHEEPGLKDEEDYNRIFPKLIQIKINRVNNNNTVMKQMGKECENRYRQSITD